MRRWRFALTAEITLHATLGTRDDHTYVRALNVPARDGFNLEVKAVSFSSLNREAGTHWTDIGPELFSST